MPRVGAGSVGGVHGVRSAGEKPSITHQIVAIEFDLDVLLALDFNRDEFLCVFFWVRNG
jgi:hypothetical protein